MKIFLSIEFKENIMESSSYIKYTNFIRKWSLIFLMVSPQYLYNIFNGNISPYLSLLATICILILIIIINSYPYETNSKVYKPPIFKRKSQVQDNSK